MNYNIEDFDDNELDDDDQHSPLFMLNEKKGNTIYIMCSYSNQSKSMKIYGTLLEGNEFIKT